MFGVKTLKSVLCSSSWIMEWGISKMKRGLIQVYTGEGKGKTTAAVGQAVRAVGRGYKAFLVQFLKKEKGSGELLSLEKLGVRVVSKEGACRSLSEISEEEREKIRHKWNDLLDQLKEEVDRGECDLLILDEVNVALHYGLIDEEKVLKFMREKPISLELILTGRYAPADIIKQADLVSEIRKVKHPFDQGIKARKGIEY